ncbi:hypothetical protein CTI12_AA481220 [Artemisia annua]|uniref:Uncharacterized protein n=1 Tax=Artemisia annua TaxID=35608 RepID=A0A2U1LK57_ARTAN|nr:hypothetical protein CTI12_AA481220 [Artemisia annua]
MGEPPTEERYFSEEVIIASKSIGLTMTAMLHTNRKTNGTHILKCNQPLLVEWMSDRITCAMDTNNQYQALHLDKVLHVERTKGKFKYALSLAVSHNCHGYSQDTDCG